MTYFSPNRQTFYVYRHIWVLDHLLSKPLSILSLHYLYFSNSLFIWRAILSNTTFYFIFIFIKIIFLLFYFNFFSLSPHLLPPRLPPISQSPRSTSKPTASISKTPETHAQAETHEAHTVGRDPRPSRDPQSRDRWRERRREGEQRKQLKREILGKMNEKGKEKA